MIGLSVVTLFAKRETIFRGFQIIARSIAWQAEHIAGINLEFRGLENLPDEGAFVFSGKHGSTLDAVAIIILLDDFTALAKQELFKIPFLSAVIRKMGLHSIDRHSGEAHKKTPRIVRAVVEKGLPLIVFPEGTRVSLGEERKLRSGAFHIQEDVDIPVITGASNAGYFWPAHQFLLRPGTMVFEVHSAMPTGLDKAEFMDELRRRVIDGSAALIDEAMART